MNSLFNHYKLINELKGGQHGEVFLIESQYDGKNYVLKKIEKDEDEEEKKKNRKRNIYNERFIK